MPECKQDCCFTSGKSWFRYRVGAIIISGNYALFATNNRDNYYYSVGGGVHMGEYSRDAVLRETMEETGLELKIERPLCIIENFFNGDGSLDGLECHGVEVWYLMKPVGKAETDPCGFNGGDISAWEKMYWLPVDRLDEYDIRPRIAKKLAAHMPNEFIMLVNDDRKR